MPPFGSGCDSFFVISFFVSPRYQLNNIYGAASPATIAELKQALDAQYNCQGTSCV